MGGSRKATDRRRTLLDLHGAPRRPPPRHTLLALWQDGSLHFTSGAHERKSLNLTANPEVVLTTGTNTWAAGFDVVVEGPATRVTEPERLHALAKAWEEKYGPAWHFEVRSDGAFQGQEGPSLVFSVTPNTVFGFGKGEEFTQTRWQFE